MLPRISAQLYTLREAAKDDFGAILDRLGEIGYAGVEVAGLPAGFHGMTLQAFADRVAAAGMIISSGHLAELTKDNRNEVLDTQDALGITDVVLAFLPPEDFADEAAVQAAADSLNAANEWVRERGMKLGYHNHFWEFSSQIGTQSAFARLFELLDSDIFAEIDTYWAQVGGANPVDVVKNFGDRAPLLHIKDGPADDPKSPMVAAGAGVIDIKGIAAVSQADWHIVELDHCASDMLEAVADSYTYLTSQELAKGRV
jgi:sugar phosphate isomerase/epimerase